MARLAQLSQCKYNYENIDKPITTREMEIPLFESSNGNCPYIEGKEWLSYLTHAEQLDEYVYEALLNKGFRRSGHIFYQNQCKDCSSCIPLRLLPEHFTPSKSQRKIIRKNQDTYFRLEPASYDPEAFRVYQAFTKERYNTSVTKEEFNQFLVRSAVDTQMVKYYDQQNKMLAVGWLDILHNSISSVYFAFDPKESRRSLGTYSVIQEMELCKKLNKSYLHLGFWVEGCQSMLYKSKFYPHQLLIDGQWGEPVWRPESESTS